MDSESTNGIIIDSDLPLLSSEILNGILGAESNICDRDKVINRQKFSCWDVLDPVLFDEAEPKTDHRIYVHGEVLEWIVEHINENILDENLRATVKEVHHHNLNGPVYLIHFFNLSKSRPFKLIANNNEIISIKNRFKYNMPWKTNPTYFLRIDSGFIDRKDQIMNQLKQLNLDKCFHATTLDVNWLYIPKIEVYEFYEFLPNERIAEIDSIFQNMSNSRAELYICDQFIWHNYFYSYIEVDKVAMDMCVEEWRRYDLLKDFSIDDILRLDLANKDYRDPYMNEYLHSYLNILLKRALPQLTSEHAKCIDVPVFRFQLYIRTYFVSRFYDRISNFMSSENRNVSNCFKYDIPLIRIGPDAIVLSDDHPTADEVIRKFCCNQIRYEISNYAHFSNSLFRTLLIKTKWQYYKIRFDQEFNFNYDSNEQLHSTNCINWTSDDKYIRIVLQNCIAQNVEKLVNFVKYLIDLFKETKNSNYIVALSFIKCVLDDYSFLENIGNCIDKIKFKKMNFSTRHIQVLSRALTQQSCVIFRDCSEITDNNVMMLLENIEFDRLWIEGKNACTPGIYFRMAERVMDKEAIDTVDANRFNRNMLCTRYNFYYHFDEIEFFNNGNQIVARNRHSKASVDLYFHT